MQQHRVLDPRGDRFDLPLERYGIAGRNYEEIVPREVPDKRNAFRSQVVRPGLRPFLRNKAAVVASRNPVTRADVLIGGGRRNGLNRDSGAIPCPLAHASRGGGRSDGGSEP